MSQFAPLSLDNSDASSSQTFNPVSLNNGIGIWREDGTVFGEVVVRPQLTLSMRPGKLGIPGNYASRVKRKVVLKVTKPYQTNQVASDAVTPIYDTIDLEVSVSVPTDSAPLQSADAVAYATQLLSEAQVLDAIVDGEFIY